jgi:hypothetical protein
MNWQPIATAPKDGRVVLLWYGGVFVGLVMAWWQEAIPADDGGARIPARWEDIGEGFTVNDATHWMPLPAPPEDTEAPRHD